MMTPGLADELSGLPTLRHYVAQVTQDLRDGRSVLWLVPRVSGGEWLVQMALNECQEHLCRDTRRVVLEEPDQLAAGPAEFLREVLDLPSDPLAATGVRHMQQTYQHEQLPGVLFLDATRLRTAQADIGRVSRQLARLYSDWVLADTSAAGGRPLAPRPLLLASALPIEPDPIAVASVRASLRCYWGVLTQLDVRYAVQVCARDAGDVWMSTWADAVYAELAGFDLELVEWLWDRSPDNDADLGAVLQEYAHSRGWGRLVRPELLGLVRDANRIPREVSRSCLEPRRELWDAWLAGLVAVIPPGGVELHSSALALLGRDEDLQHRVWRGQVRTIMPVLDSARVALCSRLTDAFGPHWTHFRAPVDTTSVSGDPNQPVTEWGHLQAVWHSQQVESTHLARHRDEVLSFWKARNDLAHHRVLRRQRFRRVLEGALDLVP